MPTVDARPGKLDIEAWPGTTVSRRLDWSASPLDGRTFEAEIVGVEDAVTVDIDEDTNLMTLVFDGAVTAALANGRYKWTLTETTAGDNVKIAGRYLLGEDTSDDQDDLVVVSVDDIPITVTVLGEPGPPGEAGEGGANATNLAYTASATQGAVTSDTGTDATIPAADATNAGLMLPAEKSKLAAIEAGAQVNEVTQAELDAEATTRANADTALDGRLNTIEAISIATDAELAAAIAALSGTYAQLAQQGTTVGNATLDGSNNLVVDVETHWGVSAGNPYYEADPDDVTAGEEAIMVVDEIGAVSWVLVSDIDDKDSAVEVERTRAMAAESLLAPKASPTFTGTVTVPDDSFALTKLANIATSRFLGRVTASPGDIEELTAAQAKTLLALAIADVSGLQAALDAKLASASYTAADVLAKLLTVDGAGSGIDADLFDGLNSTAFVRTAERDWDLPTGALAQTTLRSGQMADQALLATGRMNLAAIYLRAGQSISNISFVAGGTALVTGSNQWFSLWDSSRNKLAVTADDTSTAWAANTAKTLAVASGPYVVPTSGFYYVGITIVATTPPSLIGVGGRPAVLGLGPVLGGSSTTGLTNPASAPSTATIVGNQAAIAYAYVS